MWGLCFCASASACSCTMHTNVSGATDLLIHPSPSHQSVLGDGTQRAVLEWANVGFLPLPTVLAVPVEEACGLSGRYCPSSLHSSSVKSSELRPASLAAAAVPLTSTATVIPSLCTALLAAVPIDAPPS
mmetsp:Transcript_108734/g.162643  ORF Transcript_108734/g.162643 Transcript_108734/m.162643 type:complete len:129 (-) Transcript_108734:159-545(-)